MIICGAGKKQDEKDSDESNWYTKSKKALCNLNKKELSLPKKGGVSTLVYNYNWHLNNSMVVTQDSNNSQFDSNDKFPRKRLKSLLFGKNFSLYRSNYSTNVSEMIRSLDQFKAVKSDKKSDEGTYLDDTSVYGSVVHLFLQLLPNYSSNNINAVKDLVYKRFKDQLKDHDLIERAFLESQRVIHHSRLGPLLQDPNSYRELSVSSVLALPMAFGDKTKRDVRIKGRLDLLNLSLSEVLIIDFKTHSKVPSSVEAVDICALAQLELYSQIVNQAYPDQDISTAILWTKTASLMKIPRMNSDKALNSLFANQVLDDIKVGS